MKKISRRLFLGSASIVGTGMALKPTSIWAGTRSLDSKPALLGGEKTITKPFPRWPIVDTTEEKALLDALRGSRWGRRVKDNAADNFENNYIGRE